MMSSIVELEKMLYEIPKVITCIMDSTQQTNTECPEKC